MSVHVHFIKNYEVKGTIIYFNHLIRENCTVIQPFTECNLAGNSSPNPSCGVQSTCSSVVTHSMLYSHAHI